MGPSALSAASSNFTSSRPDPRSLHLLGKPWKSIPRKHSQILPSLQAWSLPTLLTLKNPKSCSAAPSPTASGK